MRKTTSEERGGGMFLVYYVLGLRFPLHLHITSSPALSGERLFFKDVIEFLVEMERNGIPKNSQSIMINKHDCFFVATTTKKKSNETRRAFIYRLILFFSSFTLPCLHLLGSLSGRRFKLSPDSYTLSGSPQSWHPGRGGDKTQMSLP